MRRSIFFGLFLMIALGACDTSDPGKLDPEPPEPGTFHMTVRPVDGGDEVVFEGVAWEDPGEVYPDADLPWWAIRLNDTVGTDLQLNFGQWRDDRPGVGMHELSGSADPDSMLGISFGFRFRLYPGLGSLHITSTSHDVIRGSFEFEALLGLEAFQVEGEFATILAP